MSKVAARLAGGALMFCVAPLAISAGGTAFAFPLFDPSNQSTAATGLPIAPTTELPAQDARGLASQARLLGRAVGPTGPGWTFMPRITLQEQFTDNVYEVKSPRRFDAITVLAPGISISADTSRVQLHLDYQPTLYMHAVNGPLNVLGQQFSATGLITVVPDLAYVDVRGLSGVQSRLGGLSGGGSLGTSNSDLVSAQSLGNGSGYGNAATQTGNKQNQVQTSSFGISPYLLRQFKDYGTGKLGASLDASRYSTIGGFLVNPFPAGNGTNSQTLVTTEQIAQFTTGEFLGRFQDISSVNLTQSTSRFEGFAGSTPGSVQTSSTSHSHREIFNNQLSYALTRTFTVLGSIGYENIVYGGLGYPGIHEVTWSAGGTFTPDPDSTFTLTYGRRNGGNSFNGQARYALTPRTLLSADYSDTIGTQLENLQRQLNNTTIAPNGQAINQQTGGPQFVASNGLGVQNGLFRFRTFNASLQTSLTRDTLGAFFTWSDQSNLSGPINATSYKTVGLNWTHELTPDMTLSSAASYSLIGRSGGLGTDNAFSAAVGLRYVLSPTVILTARYSFFDRMSRIPGYTAYENTLLLGVTKQF